MADFIPKQYQKEAITVRVSTDKLEIIDDMADRLSISRNEFINQCIDFALMNIEISY